MKRYNPKNSRTTALRITPATQQAVLNRDGHRCILCNSNYGCTCHHVIPKARGGMGIEQNLVTLCTQCHRAYHDDMLTDPYGERRTQEDVDQMFFEYVCDTYAHPDGYLDWQDLVYDKYRD